MLKRLHVKYPLLLSDFNELEFSRQNLEKVLNIFIKFRPLGAELFQEDGRTDMMKLIVAFRNFANAPKNWNQSENEIKEGTKKYGWMD